MPRGVWTCELVTFVARCPDGRGDRESRAVGGRGQPARGRRVEADRVDRLRAGGIGRHGGSSPSTLVTDDACATPAKTPMSRSAATVRQPTMRARWSSGKACPFSTDPASTSTAVPSVAPGDLRTIPPLARSESLASAAPNLTPQRDRVNNSSPYLRVFSQEKYVLSAITWALLRARREIALAGVEDDRLVVDEVVTATASLIVVGQRSVAAGGDRPVGAEDGGCAVAPLVRNRPCALAWNSWITLLLPWPRGRPPRQRGSYRCLTGAPLNAPWTIITVTRPCRRRGSPG